MSFIEWLRAVRSIKLAKPLDYHTLLQTSELEHAGERSYTIICKLEEDLPGCLEAVSVQTDAKFAMPSAGWDNLRHASEHQHMDGDVATRPFNRSAAPRSFTRVVRGVRKVVMCDMRWGIKGGL